MKYQNKNKAYKEKAVLVGVSTKEQSEAQLKEYLDELEFLAVTAGAKTLRRFTQNVNKPHPRTFIGSGKINTVKKYIDEHQVDMAIFDDELTPTQIRNIEEILKCKILDRSDLILDIFAQRAKTAHARTQVELAQYQYLLPRLAGMWTHLERQRGGIGMRGPGESQIETDRRIIKDKISLLKKKLEKIDKQMKTRRKHRSQLIRAALIGYTNVGKSTLMNVLGKSEVFAENKLFATLDTTTRKIVIENLPFLMSDTVGFIRKLPHHLIESFKSTLDEVVESDILLHVVDVSHPNFEEQIEIVKQTLKEIEALDKPMITIFNKIDQYPAIKENEFETTADGKKMISLTDLKETWMAKNNQDTIFISAAKEQNIDELKSLLYKRIKKLHLEIYPHQLLY